jgi:murein L,D-transpeptidase YafK
MGFDERRTAELNKTVRREASGVRSNYLESGKKTGRFFVFLLIVMVPLAVIAQVPSSPRSVKAINEVKPRLGTEMEQKGLAYGSPIFIRIFKESKELEIWVKKGRSFHLFKTYPFCTYGLRGLGPKTKEGDWRAPEGFYSVTPDRMNPSSNYHLALNVGYPNSYDRAHNRTGSAIMVHGDCVSIGCFAMTDPAIDEIYALADGAFRTGQGTIMVHIFPFRMTNEKMKKHQKAEWKDFWENLKQGYDIFERDRIPPPVTVGNKRYMFPS